MSTEPTVSCVPFGTLPDGSIVESCVLDNGNGMRAEILTYGGILNRLFAPDRDGNPADIVLGRDCMENYLNFGQCTSFVVGRVANRIKGGTYTWKGKTVHTEQNRGSDTLHGGSGNYGKRLFTAELFTLPDAAGVSLKLHDNGEGGFPGTAEVEVIYTLSADNCLSLEYRVLPSEDTPINMTHHAYFNLAGQGAENLAGHYLTLNADAFLPADKTGMPTGEIRPVEGTVFDFREEAEVQPRLSDSCEQIHQFGGLDHNYCLSGSGFRQVAFLRDEKSGRTLRVSTDQPGLQVFTANSLKCSVPGKNGAVYNSNSAICLETQQYPNAVNEPAFPCAVFPGGELYVTKTVFAFGIDQTGTVR